MYNRFGHIEFDPAKARRNFLLHGVKFGDAELALCDPMALTIEDPESLEEQRLITLGIDSLGRVLLVVHTDRGNRTRIISARKASRGETDRYYAKAL
jgi:uncharacterized DUF497 family protein